MSSSGAKPFKVWTADRSTKKAVTAATLSDFISKAKNKLNIPEGETVKVVFETDGTEVDDDDYFQFLPFNTTLILLRDGQTWTSEAQDQGHDEPDFMMPDGSEVSERVRVLTTALKKEITRLITFSNQDLQEMVDMETEILANLLNETKTYAASVQEACQRHLDERNQTSEALDLLKLYHRAREYSPIVEGDDNSKRMKKANT